MNTRRYKNILLAAAVAVQCSISCMDGYETLPVDHYTSDYVFSTTDSAGAKALGLLSTVYNMLSDGHNRVGGDYLDAASDDAISIKMASTPDVLKLQLGQYTPRTRVTSDMIWGDYYTAIRRVNILLSGVDRVPFNETYTDALGQVRPLNVTLKAEARFLRAWFYFQLLERYGGVTLLGDNVYDISDDLELPRNSFAECVDYIVTELDEIKDSLRTLPMDNPSTYAHVATKPACMALKARVLLYAASPLFNGSTIEEGNDLVGYTDYSVERWHEAAVAAKELIDEYGENGTGTFKLAPDSRDVFLGFYERTTNPELIFFRQGGNGTDVETDNGPLGFSGDKLGNGRTNPTQNLVDAFLMKDGKRIGESTKYVYDSQNPYDNRDPRLDKTILYNGAKWFGSALETWQGGANNPSSASEYSQTSYYMNKFMGKFADASDYTSVLHAWVMFRWTEVLLNYAEAENEYLAAPSEDVYNVIKALRERGGIEAGDDGMYGLTGTETKDEMREIIQNERRIELAFEEHRFYDIRRWRLAEKVFAEPLRGMRIVQGVGGYTYSEIDVLEAPFETKRYLYPIPYSEVNKNKNMVQNPNWK